MSYNQLLKGRCSQAFYVYHITICTKNKHPYFADFHSARILIHEMKKLHDEQLLLSLAFAVMPNHLHWLLQLGGCATLSQVFHKLKGRTARQINHYRKQQGSIWQKGYYDHGIRAEENLRVVARYIVSNPLKDGLVQSLADYPHWDAIWL